MRTLTDHVVDGDSVNHQVDIQVLDEPGPGGANHKYRIRWDPPNDDLPSASQCCYDINFQNGPIKEVGINGLTHEALIAVCIDRLRMFQAGKFACQDNKDAIGHLRNALNVLQQRTRARIARGIEGTHQV